MESINLLKWGKTENHISRMKKNKMKTLKLFLIVGVFLLATTATFAQIKEQELSNAEKFSAKAGALIQKEFVEIGSVKDADITLINFTDLITNTRQSALKFECFRVRK